MGILGHHANHQFIGQPVIDAQTDAAGGEVVPSGVRIAVHADKITEPSHPDAPTISRSGLQDRFHHCFGGFAVRIDSVLQIHGGAVDFHVGTESVGSVVEIVHPAFQIQSLNVGVRKADFIKC